MFLLDSHAAIIVGPYEAMLVPFSKSDDLHSRKSEIAQSIRLKTKKRCVRWKRGNVQGRLQSRLQGT